MQLCLTCSTCRQLIVVDDYSSGAKVQCPHCRTAVSPPILEQAVAAATAQGSASANVPVEVVPMMGLDKLMEPQAGSPGVELDTVWTPDDETDREPGLRPLDQDEIIDEELEPLEEEEAAPPGPPATEEDLKPLEDKESSPILDEDSCSTPGEQTPGIVKLPAPESVLPQPFSLQPAPDESERDASRQDSFDVQANPEGAVIQKDNQVADVSASQPGLQQAVTDSPSSSQQTGITETVPEPPSVIDANAPIVNEATEQVSIRKKDKPAPEQLEEARALKTTSTGLALVQWGFLCFIIAMAVIAVLLTFICIAAGVTIAGAVQMRAPGAAPPGSLRSTVGSIILIVLLNVALLLLASAVLTLIGQIFCCFAPKKANARIYSITGLWLAVGAVMLIVFSSALAAVGLFFATGTTAAACSLLSDLTGLAGWFMVLGSFGSFFLFLRAFGRYMDDQGSAREAMDLIFLWAAFLLYPHLALWVTSFCMSLHPFFGIYVGVFFGLCSLFWMRYGVRELYRTFNLVSSLRQGLATYYGL